MRLVTYSQDHWVERHRGTMPILLMCPHDGEQSPPGVAERNADDTPRGCDFQKLRDTHVRRITHQVATRILELTGLSPYMVTATVHRKFIDLNRSKACAFTDQAVEPVYDEYHGCIANYVHQIVEQNDGRGFMFDLHGCREVADDPADVYLGTANGKTLLSSFDRECLFMDHGLHGLLEAEARYRVSPADAKAKETRHLEGGYTVRHYASLLNCIQIEIADTIRADEARRDLFIDDLALALVSFVRQYAPF